MSFTGQNFPNQSHFLPPQIHSNIGTGQLTYVVPPYVGVSEHTGGNIQLPGQVTNNFSHQSAGSFQLTGSVPNHLQLGGLGTNNANMLGPSAGNVFLPGQNSVLLPGINASDAFMSAQNSWQFQVPDASIIRASLPPHNTQFLSSTRNVMNVPTNQEWLTVPSPRSVLSPARAGSNRPLPGSADNSFHLFRETLPPSADQGPFQRQVSNSLSLAGQMTTQNTNSIHTAGSSYSCFQPTFGNNTFNIGPRIPVVAVAPFKPQPSKTPPGCQQVEQNLLKETRTQPHFSKNDHRQVLTTALSEGLTKPRVTTVAINPLLSIKKEFMEENQWSQPAVLKVAQKAVPAVPSQPSSPPISLLTSRATESFPVINPLLNIKKEYLSDQRAESSVSLQTYVPLIAQQSTLSGTSSVTKCVPSINPLVSIKKEITTDEQFSKSLMTLSVTKSCDTNIIPKVSIPNAVSTTKSALTMPFVTTVSLNPLTGVKKELLQANWNSQSGTQEFSPPFMRGMEYVIVSGNSQFNTSFLSGAKNSQVKETWSVSTTAVTSTVVINPLMSVENTNLTEGDSSSSAIPQGSHPFEANVSCASGSRCETRILPQPTLSHSEISTPTLTATVTTTAAINPLISIKKEFLSDSCRIGHSAVEHRRGGLRTNLDHSPASNRIDTFRERSTEEVILYKRSQSTISAATTTVSINPLISVKKEVHAESCRGYLSIPQASYSLQTKSACAAKLGTSKHSLVSKTEFPFSVGTLSPHASVGGVTTTVTANPLVSVKKDFLITSSSGHSTIQLSALPFGTSSQYTPMCSLSTCVSTLETGSSHTVVVRSTSSNMATTTVAINPLISVKKEFIAECSTIPQSMAPLHAKPGFIALPKAAAKSCLSSDTTPKTMPKAQSVSGPSGSEKTSLPPSYMLPNFSGSRAAVMASISSSFAPKGLSMPLYNPKVQGPFPSSGTSARPPFQMPNYRPILPAQMNQTINGDQLTSGRQRSLSHLNASTAMGGNQANILSRPKVRPRVQSPVCMRSNRQNDLRNISLFQLMEMLDKGILDEFISKAVLPGSDEFMKADRFYKMATKFNVWGIQPGISEEFYLYLVCSHISYFDTLELKEKVADALKNKFKSTNKETKEVSTENTGWRTEKIISVNPEFLQKYCEKGKGKAGHKDSASEAELIKRAFTLKQVTKEGESEINVVPLLPKQVQENGPCVSESRYHRVAQPACCATIPHADMLHFGSPNAVRPSLLQSKQTPRQRVQRKARQKMPQKPVWHNMEIDLTDDSKTKQGEVKDLCVKIGDFDNAKAPPDARKKFQDKKEKGLATKLSQGKKTVDSALLSCHLCPYRSSLNGVWRHIVFSHVGFEKAKTVMSKYFCTHCYMNCATYSQVVAHEQSAHLSDNPCFFCGLAIKGSQSRNSRYWQHICLKHCQMYPCTCNERFSSYAELSKHCENSGHCKPPEDLCPRVFTCLYCVENYLTQGSLTEHVLLQHSEPPLSVSKICKVCNKLFLDQTALDFHNSEDSGNQQKAPEVSNASLDNLQKFVWSQSTWSSEETQKIDKMCPKLMLDQMFSLDTLVAASKNPDFSSHQLVSLNADVEQASHGSRKVVVEGKSYKYDLSKLIEHLEVKDWADAVRNPKIFDAILEMAMLEYQRLNLPQPFEMPALMMIATYISRTPIVKKFLNEHSVEQFKMTPQIISIMDIVRRTAKLCMKPLKYGDEGNEAVDLSGTNLMTVMLFNKKTDIKQKERPKRVTNKKAKQAQRNKFKIGCTHYVPIQPKSVAVTINSMLHQDSGIMRTSPAVGGMLPAESSSDTSTLVLIPVLPFTTTTSVSSTVTSTAETSGEQFISNIIEKKKGRPYKYSKTEDHSLPSNEDKEKMKGIGRPSLKAVARKTSVFGDSVVSTSTPRRGLRKRKQVPLNEEMFTYWYDSDETIVDSDTDKYADSDDVWEPSNRELIKPGTTEVKDNDVDVTYDKRDDENKSLKRQWEIKQTSSTDLQTMYGTMKMKHKTPKRNLETQRKNLETPKNKRKRKCRNSDDFFENDDIQVKKRTSSCLPKTSQKPGLRSNSKRWCLKEKLKLISETYKLRSERVCKRIIQSYICLHYYTDERIKCCHVRLNRLNEKYMRSSVHDLCGAGRNENIPKPNQQGKETESERQHEGSENKKEDSEKNGNGQNQKKVKNETQSKEKCEMTGMHEDLNKAVCLKAEAKIQKSEKACDEYFADINNSILKVKVENVERNLKRNPQEFKTFQDGKYEGIVYREMEKSFSRVEKAASPDKKQKKVPSILRKAAKADSQSVGLAEPTTQLPTHILVAVSDLPPAVVLGPPVINTANGQCALIPVSKNISAEATAMPLVGPATPDENLLSPGQLMLAASSFNSPAAHRTSEVMPVVAQSGLQLLAGTGNQQGLVIIPQAIIQTPILPAPPQISGNPVDANQCVVAISSIPAINNIIIDPVQYVTTKLSSQIPVNTPLIASIPSTTTGRALTQVSCVPATTAILTSNPMGLSVANIQQMSAVMSLSPHMPVDQGQAVSVLAHQFMKPSKLKHSSVNPQQSMPVTMLELQKKQQQQNPSPQQTQSREAQLQQPHCEEQSTCSLSEPPTLHLPTLALLTTRESSDRFSQQLPSLTKHAPDQTGCSQTLPVLQSLPSSTSSVCRTDAFEGELPRQGQVERPSQLSIVLRQESERVSQLRPIAPKPGSFDDQKR